MPAIRGIGRMTIGEMRAEIKNGARFVVFEYVLSFVVTRRKVSPVFFKRPGESVFSKSLPYNLITLILGWWSFPFGPANTIVAIRDNLRGGRDVTAKTIDEILEAADKQMQRKRTK